MDYDFDKHYHLTRPVVSDETKRARHALVFICTLIIASHYLSIDLSQVKAAGIDLSNTSPVKVTVVALIIIVFWNFILVINFRRDFHDAQERSALVREEISSIKAEVARQNNELANGSNITFGNRKKQLAYLESYNLHLDRMKRLTFFENLIFKVNVYLPHVLSLLAISILVKNVCCYLAISEL